MLLRWPPKYASSNSTGPLYGPHGSPAHASRIRMSMNQAVFCDTPMSLWSFMLDTLLEVNSKVRPCRIGMGACYGIHHLGP